MPYRAKHGCAWPGCPALTNERYCETHAKVKQKEYDARRGSSAERGYDYRWQRLRKMVLASQPICADPFGVHRAHGEVVAAKVADHIIPRRAGGDDSMDNLQGLCEPCHNRKTASEDGGFGN